MPIEILIYPKSFNAKCIYNDGMCVYAYEDNILYTRREGFIIRKFVYFFFIVCKVGIKGAKKKKTLAFRRLSDKYREKKREREREIKSGVEYEKKKRGESIQHVGAQETDREKREKARGFYVFNRYSTWNSLWKTKKYNSSSHLPCSLRRSYDLVAPFIMRLIVDITTPTPTLFFYSIWSFIVSSSAFYTIPH